MCKSCFSDFAKDVILWRDWFREGIDFAKGIDWLFERDKIIQSQVEEMLAACLAKYIQHPQMQVHYNLVFHHRCNFAAHFFNCSTFSGGTGEGDWRSWDPGVRTTQVNVNNKRAHRSILVKLIKLFKSSKYLAVAAVEWQDTDEDQVSVSPLFTKYRKSKR